jgi:3-phosphoshikimate 1-carboxyvinyltransferase
MGLAASRPFVSRFAGDRYLCARPMRRVATPLEQMGAVVEGQSGARPGELYAPLSVRGPERGRLRGVRHVCAVASAQVKSALLLAGLAAEGATVIEEPARSRDHTERLLVHLGAPISVAERTVVLDPRGWDRRLMARPLEVPGDLSSAAFLLGAALVVGGSRIRVRGVGCNPTRTGLLDALHAMGAGVTREAEHEAGAEPVCDLAVVHAGLTGTAIAGELAVRAIDELPLLATLGAHASGTTTVRDAAELRVKESDRIAATEAMLRAFGVPCEAHADGLTVEGGAVLTPADVDSRGDHRIAMSAAICALAVDGETRVRDVDNIATSFPGFVDTLRQLGADLRISSS